MARIRSHKVNSLPSLVANALYYIKDGSWFDFRATDSSGNGFPIALTEAMRMGVNPAIADQTIANTLTKIAGTELAFANGQIKQKMVLRWTINGITTGGTGSSTLSLRCGSANTTADGAIASWGLVQATTGTNIPFSISVNATLRSVGSGSAASVRASGQIAKSTLGGIGGGSLTVILGGNVAVPTHNFALPTYTSFDSTGSKFMHLDFISGNANTSITVHQAFAEVLFPGD